ncbi:MAG: hypothetical protein KJ077_50730 [Anaerolineae bacterium]|nr:hypothetical protein [Anaerolineae bacterium]
MPPHYRQSNPGACLPACTRMVLAALSDKRSEAQISKLLGSFDFGTPASRITRLEKWGYRVQFGPASLNELHEHLGQSHYPIVFVYAGFLPWADFDGFHALVLVELTPTEVSLLDPALDEGPTSLSVDGFLLAWEEFDSLAVVIRGR